MRNPEMLKFVPDYLKSKKMCKHTDKKLPFLIRYVPDRYKTQQMCDKVILENGGTLGSVPDYKGVDNYSHALKYIPDCYVTQKSCDKAVNTYHSTIQFVPNSYKAFDKCFLVFAIL